MMTNRHRILIADTHNLVGELCKSLLETEFDVVGMVTNGNALVQTALESRCDVLLTDTALPFLDGLEAGRQVKAMRPTIKVIYWTMNDHVEVAARAFEQGASGYLLKTCTAEEMFVALHEILSGNTYLSRGLSRQQVDCSRWQGKKLIEESRRLSSRQREVLRLLAEGKGMKEVGGILNLTPRTIAFHKYRIMEALGARNSADLIKYAVSNHLVDIQRSVSKMAAHRIDVKNEALAI
jgi:DNA-binding NarL/FixJ family response regulator